MAKGFYFDMTTCVGCKACAIACKDRNNTETGVNFRIVKTYETGEFPNPGFYHYSSSCNHCEEPACVPVCPVGAMYKTEEGAVVVDQALCVGCLSCSKACPYKAPKFMKSIEKMGKCDSCYAQRQEGKNPACVDACMMRCLKFGEISEFKGEKPVDELPMLPNADETKPNLAIKPKTAAKEENFVQKEI